jgi:hypothetical protein
VNVLELLDASTRLENVILLKNICRNSSVSAVSVSKLFVRFVATISMQLEDEEMVDFVNIFNLLTHDVNPTVRQNCAKTFPVH